MAKKPADSRGKKTCPKCETVTGVRSKICPKCGHEFPVKSKPTKSKPTDLAAALELLKDLQAFSKESGGLDSAIEWIDSVDKLAQACGGLDELRTALKTASEL